MIKISLTPSITNFNSLLEIGGNKLDFLDVTIIKSNNKIEFDWFHKPTFLDI